MMQEVIIEAGRAERHYWHDLWRYRELFRVLAWRDVAVRYKQTVIGIAWALIRPFLTMVVFTVIFGKLANFPSEGTAPYAILVFAGMLPWTFFSSALSDASNSILSNANLISKVYFPRLIVPMAAVAVALVDFAINFVMLVVLMIWYRYVPGWQIVLLPIFVAIDILRQPGTQFVAHCAQHQISGRTIRYPVRRSDGTVCIAGRLQLEHSARTMAAALLVKSSRRHHRRVSLVYTWPTKRFLSTWFPVEYRRHWLLSVAGNSYVPKLGKALCRSDLTRCEQENQCPIPSSPLKTSRSAI